MRTFSGRHPFPLRSKEYRERKTKKRREDEQKFLKKYGEQIDDATMCNPRAKIIERVEK